MTDKDALDALQLLENFCTSDGEACEQEMRDACDTIRAALSTQGWKDISSAPRGGIRMLLFGSNPTGIYTGKWFAQKPRGIRGNYFMADNGYNVYPTHWMPLPQPPHNGDEK